jgi:hypothetical protein
MSISCTFLDEMAFVSYRLIISEGLKSRADFYERGIRILPLCTTSWRLWASS